MRAAPTSRGEPDPDAGQSDGARRRAGRRRLSSFLIRQDARLIEALRAVDRGREGITFVCDARGRVAGAFTDGDARRAILSGATLESRCLPGAMQRHFISVSPSAGRAEVLDLMRSREVRHVPVLDRRGRLCGLHTLRDLLGMSERSNWAVIMAGGFGKRLFPLTEKVPKPMLPIAGRPILERLVLHLIGSGFRRIFLSVNYLSQIIEGYFGDGARYGCRIEYLREPEPLGTAGALSLLPSVSRLPLLVVNGDLVTQFNVANLLEHHERGHCAITFGVRPHSVAIPYGVARVRGSRLIELKEKPTERMLINAGIYVLSPNAVRMIPRGRLCAMTELFTICTQRKLAVGAHLIEEDWMDVGRPTDLRRARGGT